MDRFAFRALTLLAGCHDGHLACKNWVVRYWRGYLSRARCEWFAYGPADATATPSSLASVKSRMFCQVLLEKGRSTDVVVVAVDRSNRSVITRLVCGGSVAANCAFGYIHCLCYLMRLIWVQKSSADSLLCQCITSGSCTVNTPCYV